MRSSKGKIKLMVGVVLDRYAKLNENFVRVKQSGASDFTTIRFRLLTPDSCIPSQRDIKGEALSRLTRGLNVEVTCAEESMIRKNTRVI